MCVITLKGNNKFVSMTSAEQISRKKIEDHFNAQLCLDVSEKKKGKSGLVLFQSQVGLFSAT